MKAFVVDLRCILFSEGCRMRIRLVSRQRNLNYAELNNIKKKLIIILIYEVEIQHNFIGNSYGLRGTRDE